MKKRIDLSEYIGICFTDIPKELVKLKKGVNVYDGTLLFNEEFGIVLLYAYNNYKLMNSKNDEYLDRDILSTIEFELNTYTA